MKLNWKSIGITIGLILVLCIVIWVEISMFVSGPQRKYEYDVNAQKNAITAKYKEIKNIKRHVFYYTTYVGEDDKNIVWFNEKAKAIVYRKKDTLKMAQVEAEVKNKYHTANIQISLGYGYRNPVYVIESDAGMILLDYDTLKEVYFLEKGEV